MLKKSLRNLLIFSLIFIVSFSVLPFKAYAASYFTGNKWNKSVVSVYIDDTPTPSQGGATIPSYYYAYWHSNIEEGVVRWNTMLNNAWHSNIMFILADNASNADIIIKYGTRPSSWAQTFPTASNGFFQKVVIEIRDWSFYQYQFDVLTQTDIVAHELGHALGLADISEQQASSAGIYSIMVNSIYPPSAHFSRYMTEFDRNNIFTLYP